MATFILGYNDEDIEVTADGRNLTQYKNKNEAAFESCEWCEIEAGSLHEAKLMYEAKFADWQASVNC